MTGPGVEVFLDPEEVIVLDGRRRVDQAVVKKLAESIERMGLLNPITVRERAGEHTLVAGLHRLEAHKRLKKPGIRCFVVKMTKDEARMAEISENLHRSDLTKIERDEMVAEWVALAEKEVSGQFVQNPPRPEGGRPEGGISAASRELNIDRKDAERAIKVASLSNKAKQAARDEGLDDNRSALLAAAKETTPEAQVAKIVEIKANKSHPGRTTAKQIREERRERGIKTAKRLAKRIIEADREAARQLREILEWDNYRVFQALAKELCDALVIPDAVEGLATLAASRTHMA